MEVLIYIPEDKVSKNLGGCSIELRFCGGHVCQVTVVDRYDEESLYFTELPKGHGRLGDLDELEQRISSFVEHDANITDEYTVVRQRFIVNGIRETEAIIEADKEDAECR